MNSSYKNWNRFEVDENCPTVKREGARGATLNYTHPYLTKLFFTYIFDSNNHYSDIVIDDIVGSICISYQSTTKTLDLHKPNSSHSIAALSARWHQARGRRAINLSSSCVDQLGLQCSLHELVRISCLGILHICNLWILLRKIVIYLVGRKCYLRGLFCCWSWLK